MVALTDVYAVLLSFLMLALMNPSLSHVRLTTRDRPLLSVRTLPPYRYDALERRT